MASRAKRNGHPSSMRVPAAVMETAHLLKSPANARHLEKSIAQYRKGKTRVRKLQDA